MIVAMLSVFAPTLIGLRFSNHIPSVASHEIDGVSRGLGVYYRDSCIVGEGMGIGAPIALLERKAVFPLDVEDFESTGRLVRRFHLNGFSLKFLGRARADVPYKWIRSQLAPLYLRSSRFRPLFNYLMAARTVVGIRSRYRRINGLGYVDVAYEANGDRVLVHVDASHLDAKKFLIANELDGHLFRELIIDDTIRIPRISPWLEIRGSDARIVAPTLGMSFRLRQIEGCSMFAGREVLGNRLNWAGFSYQPSKGVDSFGYEVVFEKND